VKPLSQEVLPDHVRVCFLLCPNPKVMQYAKDNPDPEDRQALERLLQKEFIDPNVGTSEERECEFATVLDKFLTELSDFQYQQVVFAKAHIWIIAEDEQYLAHIWHEKYSVP
jgi:hypothetical protein